MALAPRFACACVLALALVGCGFEHGTAALPDAPTKSITVAFGDPETSADEESGTVEVAVTLSSVSTRMISVGYRLGSGTATRPDDYVLADGTLTFMPGQTQQQIAIAIAMDAVEESEETVVVQLADPVGATLGATTSHTVTISSDILPRASFMDATPSTANEATSPMVEVRLTVAPKQQVTVEVGVTGTATAADRGLTDGTVITFPAGVTSQLVPLGIVQDALDEADETVVLALKNPSAKLVLAPTNTVRMHTISDDDAPPQAAFSQGTASVNEAMTAVSLTVALSSVSGLDISVPFSLAGASTADNPDDFTFASTAALLIPAGMTSATVVVNVKADTLHEANESVVVDLGTPTNATLGAVARETLTINDDDAAPTVAFTSMGSQPNENNANITLTVQLSDISGQDVTVPFSIDAASTASDPADYTITASPVIIPAGQTSITITIAMKEDGDAEADETVIVVLDTPTNAMLATPSTYTLRIKNDD